MKAALREPPARESRAGKILLLAFILGFLGVFILLPLLTIFTQALKQGLAAYLMALAEPEAAASIRLTLLTALICVPANTAAGLLLAWAVSKFEFPGKNALITMIEIPFAVSPVIAGLLFGRTD